MSNVKILQGGGVNLHRCTPHSKF